MVLTLQFLGLGKVRCEYLSRLRYLQGRTLVVELSRVLWCGASKPSSISGLDCHQRDTELSHRMLLERMKELPPAPVVSTVVSLVGPPPRAQMPPMKVLR
jgi:hypothetical protein